MGFVRATNYLHLWRESVTTSELSTSFTLGGILTKFKPKFSFHFLQNLQSIVEDNTNTHFIIMRVTCPLYLFVEVEETFGAVNVMEGWERLDGAVDAHGVKPHGSTRGDQHPVRRRTTDEHLGKQGYVDNQRRWYTTVLVQWNEALMSGLSKAPPYSWVSRDVLKVSESGDPTPRSWTLVWGSALCLLIFLELWFLLSEVDVVGHLCRVKQPSKDSFCLNLAGFSPSLSVSALTFLKRTFRLFCGCCWS